MKVYGIPNCNTVKKAIDWIKSNNVQFEFHDYKKNGITKGKLKEWSKEVGWEKLLNKKGTTWRGLSPEQQQQVKNEKTAIELMIEKPSIIKRPVIETGGKLLVGFDEEEYMANLKK
ncbi:ArsC family reductase [Segetibacter aerophilus]|uniref:Arsenate reductase n=1 Tax=Segetibacter aerophilus TaxID=670293 RepID=A0A512BBP6_9BACT|nr:ArsC family reductase [Segetibacter aerophilus]GEO09403.1 arsenate reductase [Segetibacter aerophilus]